MVLAEAVRDEVETNLLRHAEHLVPVDANQLVEDYRKLVQLVRPVLVAYPERSTVLANRHLIRHLPDVPVLLSAIASKPDWLLTHNTKHFTPAVARRCGLRIATPIVFFKTLSSLL